ncbi:esterase/lipase family protein [Marinobacter sp.]|uniref:esterase/lipase family protein n=1 Tax=Marinobacter sp. TaxID=50741 RepID=UPI003565AAC4
MSTERSSDTTGNSPCEPGDDLSHPPRSADLIGTSRLIIDAFDGVTDIVEVMHRNISGLAPVIGPGRPGPTRGVTGLVYRNIRRVSALTGQGLEFTLSRFAPMLANQESTARRDALLAALNGVLGDYLVASANPLAIPMELRYSGRRLMLEHQALLATIPHPSNRLLVMVHGLCMNDRQWLRNGHDHGKALAHDLGYTPLYLRYNSGRSVPENGRDFALLLEALVSQWPVPVEKLVIVGHSMGGLVTRSACLEAQHAGYHWPARLREVIFLGTPHQGATLEQLGSGLECLLGISPYSAPIGRLGNVRSAGIRDLREGNIGQVTGPETQAGTSTAPETPPRGTRYYAIAATTGSSPAAASTLARGDGLVPLRSALGQHRDPARCLPIPDSRQAVFHGLNHFDLLDSQPVYQCLLGWLTEH